MLYRLSMNMNISVGSILVCYVAIKFAHNSAMRILKYTSRRATILTCSVATKNSSSRNISVSFSIRWCE